MKTAVMKKVMFECEYCGKQYSKKQMAKDCEQACSFKQKTRDQTEQIRKMTEEASRLKLDIQQLRLEQQDACSHSKHTTECYDLSKVYDGPTEGHVCVFCGYSWESGHHTSDKAYNDMLR